MSDQQNAQKTLTLALTTAAWARWSKERQGQDPSPLEINDFIKNLLSDAGEPNDQVAVLYLATEVATLDSPLIDSFVEHSKIFDHFDGQGSPF